MNEIVISAPSTSLIVTETAELRPLVTRAANTLAHAASAAEVLDAAYQAEDAYDAAKKAAVRLAKAKVAHDDIHASMHRVQADSLEILALAKRRLADEYDAAQERGEVAGHGGKRGNQHGNVIDENLATVADIGLSRPQVFEARQIRDAIEKEPGVLRRVLDELLDTGEEPTKAKLRRELAPVIARERKIVQTEKKERRHAREIALAHKIEALPDRRYGVILADPEWRFEPYSRETGMDRSPDNHYPTSETGDIMSRDVPSIAADDCVLFLWRTAPMSKQAHEVMEAWGFTFKSEIVWVKERSGDQTGTGYWFLNMHEVLMVGVRGKVPAPAMGDQYPSAITARVGEHSAKPEAFLEMIEDYFPNIPKIELNRRGAARPGWDAWGLEASPAEPEEIAASDLSGQGLTATPPEGSLEAYATSQGEAMATYVDSLYERGRAILADMDPDFGRMIRATRVSQQLEIDWDTAVILVDRIAAADAASASKLPPAPTLPSEPITFEVIERKKSLYANFTIFVTEYGTFKTADDYWLGYVGHGGPAYGDHPTFAGALIDGLSRLALALRRVVDDTSSPCAKSHKVAARAGLKWLEKQAGEWGLLERMLAEVDALTARHAESAKQMQARIAARAKQQVEPDTIDIEEFIAKSIPAPTEDELVEHKMLAAIDAGLVVGGDMFEVFVERGLILAADMIGLSFAGSDRLQQLDNMVKAHSHGDAVRCQPDEALALGGAA